MASFLTVQLISAQLYSGVALNLNTIPATLPRLVLVFLSSPFLKMLITTGGDPPSELHVTTTSLPGSALIQFLQFVKFCRTDRRGSVGGKTTTSEIETVTYMYILIHLQISIVIYSTYHFVSLVLLYYLNFS